MAKQYSNYGLSTIITTLIIIVISIVAVGLVWVSVRGMIKTQISNSESCFGNYNKVTLNPQYTCYEEISPTSYNLRFSLSVGDIKVDKIIVSVSSASSVSSYTITNTPQTISGLSMYPSGDSNIIVPNMSGGLTYKATGFTSGIDEIKIAPVIGGNSCDVSDSITQLEDCALMT
jgi:hypothetical protein